MNSRNTWQPTQKDLERPEYRMAAWRLGFLVLAFLLFMEGLFLYHGVWPLVGLTPLVIIWQARILYRGWKCLYY